MVWRTKRKHLARKRRCGRKATQESPTGQKVRDRGVTASKRENKKNHQEVESDGNGGRESKENKKTPQPESEGNGRSEVTGETRKRWSVKVESGDWRIPFGVANIEGRGGTGGNL